MLKPGSIVVDSVSKRFHLQTAPRADDLREVLSRRFRRRPEEKEEDDGSDGGGSGGSEFWALRDVSFTVEPGEIFGIIGHNGSGKSTMLKLLTGILHPTHGSVRVAGRIGALIEVGAGFHPDLTGRENIFLNGSIMGLSQREIARLFDRIVAFSELERFIDTPVKRYSSGMYTRLGFAIVAHINPDVLLIDEVLAVGDMAFQAKCMNRIREMNAAGATIAFVSHDMGAVAKLCPRAVLLNGGRVRAEGPVQVVVNAHERDMMAHMAAQFRKDEAVVEAAEAAEAAETVEATKEAEPEGPPPARITYVELVDGRGEPSRLYQTGDTVTLRIGYEAERALSRCEVGIAIRRVDGVLCYGPNTTADAEPIEIGAGVGTVEVTFPDLQLLGDTYTVTTAILEEGRMLDHREGLCRFVIEDGRGEYGIVRLPHQWRHQPGGEPGRAGLNDTFLATGGGAVPYAPEHVEAAGAV